MIYSYWDRTIIDGLVDVTIVGAGFSGMYLAEQVKQKYPDASVLLIDRHHLTRTASTRNAGFACFGSLTEIESDLRSISKEACQELVSRRYAGIQVIKNRFSADRIDWEPYGGYELILKSETTNQSLKERIAQVNHTLNHICPAGVFQLADDANDRFGLNGDYHIVENKLEAGLNPAKVISEIKKSIVNQQVGILENTVVDELEEVTSGYSITTNMGTIKSRNVILANNSLVGKLVPEYNTIRPARNIIMVSHAINALKLKGVFHMDAGYIYFRSISGNRVLIGGGRHWDEAAEFTSEYGWNQEIERKLHELISSLLPTEKLTWQYKWSGIMGIGESKEPKVEKIKEGLYVCAGFGGMGVALTASSAEYLVKNLLNL